MATIMNKQETLLLVTLALSFLTVCACERLETETGKQEAVVSSLDPVDAVDLGVVYTRSDGTTYTLLWATRNLCKTGFVRSHEAFGDYYGWGDIAPQDVYDWPYYRWSDGKDHKLTRYCPKDKAGFWFGPGIPDGKTSFEDYNYVDDAARQALGGDWRIPTYAEWEALQTQCTWKWVTVNGVNGRRITGPNGKSIFLPAAGNRYNTILNYPGSVGHYWAASLFTGHPYFAWSIALDANHVSWKSTARPEGYQIRPVKEEVVRNSGNGR